MKVLYLSHGPNLDGGAEKVLLRAVERLDRRRFAPVVVVPGRGQFSARLEELGVPHHVLPQAWMVFKGASVPVLAVNCLLNSGPVRRLRELIAAERIDLVYSNSLVIFGGGVAARLAGVPHLWHLHELVWGNPSLGFGFGPDVLRAAIDVLSDRAVAVSQAVAANLGLEGLGERLVVVPNGLRETAWEPPEPGAGEAARRELGIPAEAPVALFLGSLAAYKAPERAVAALGELRRDDAYLLMVGSAGEAATTRRIEQAIAGYGLGARVIRTGFRTDVPRFLAASDVALVPTLTEAWGLATAEAMAAGLPVVAGKGGNNVDLIADGETGFLVDGGEPAGLARGLELLLADPGRRRAMGEAARQTSRQYTVERQLAGMAAAMEAAAAAVRPVSSAGALLRQISSHAKR
jgi:glycosyltransferase involved in cell wall biosynthesis